MTIEKTRTLPEPDWDSLYPPRSRFRWVAWLLVMILLAGAAWVGLGWRNMLPDWLHNPFAKQVVDQSQPPVLLSIRNMSRFVAAQGNFEVVVDVKNDRRYVPDWLLSERTLLVAAATVDAYVDFGGLTEDKVKTSVDRTAVEITLPQPRLEEPRLDIQRSYVYSEDRGLINKFGDFFSNDPNRQKDAMLLAQQRIAGAADGSQLKTQAQENTRKMLQTLLGSMGYKSVTVNFA